MGFGIYFGDFCGARNFFVWGCSVVVCLVVREVVVGIIWLCSRLGRWVAGAGWTRLETTPWGREGRPG